MRTIALLAAASILLPACYTARAGRQSKRIVRSGFDFEDHGPWVLFTAPGSLLLAGGNFLLGSIVPLGGGVDPREPENKWFHAYPGPMRPGDEVAILCHRERATWVTAIRALPDGAWQEARYEKWHFPVCLEVLPGSYELQVHYFAREHDQDQEESVTRQAESTLPSTLHWDAEAGQVYLLTAYLGKAHPSQATPPQRHIPRSRSLGTTWWGLEESDWYVRVERYASWDSLQGPVIAERKEWERYEASRR